jgi:hypothetical protein
MRHLLPFLLLVIINLPVVGQKVKREVTIRPDEVADEAFPFKDRYQFAAFEDGYLITPKGQRTQQLRLNFDNFHGLPKFIDKKGDTLVVNDALVKSVHIKGRMFVKYEKGKYYQMLLANAPAQLGITRFWRIARLEARYLDASTGREEVSFSRDKGNTYYSKKLGKTVKNEFRIYKLDTAYVLIDDKGKTHKATRGNLSKILPEQKNQIDSFLKEEDVDFDKEEDIKKLLLSLASSKL